MSARVIAAAEPNPIVDQEIERICDELLKKGLLNGVVLVAHGDTIIHHQAYGIANAEFGIAHRLDSRFMVASVTKSLTACVVLQAVEQGKLDLHQPIAVTSKSYGAPRRAV